MNQPIENPQLPNAVVVPLQSLSKYGALQSTTAKLVQWTQQHTKYLQQYVSKVQTQLNTQVQGVGAAIASAPVITVSSATHHVTGTSAIKTINVEDGFSGPIFLIPDDAWTLVTGGNIALAASAVVNKMLILGYDPTPALWYPSYT